MCAQVAVFLTMVAIALGANHLIASRQRRDATMVVLCALTTLIYFYLTGCLGIRPFIHSIF